MELLSEANACEQTMLTLVSRGSAIITEILRLSDYIPPAFRNNPPPEASKYQKLICDFSYLNNADEYEDKIYSDAELMDLDENFRESHGDILERFYTLFESVYKYHSNYAYFLRQLSEGYYIQDTVESLLQNPESKKLMCEMLYLLGVMLLLLDLKYSQNVREKLLISYYRYKGHSTIENIDEVCHICRATGFSGSFGNHPQGYPENYFARCAVPADVIEQIIGHLKDDDLYNQFHVYPSPNHRPNALSSQAAMLVVTLFFAPNILNTDISKMREIVDKFFPDNWVVPFYLGFTFHLPEVWGSYNAAKNGLNSFTIIQENISGIVTKQIAQIPTLLKGLRHYLREGVLNEEYIIRNGSKLLNLMRECNITLRWILLQRTTRVKKIYDMIASQLEMASLLELLMYTAQYERVIKSKVEIVLQIKDSLWEEDKSQAAVRMEELADFFSGNRPLTRGVEKNENYQQWFTEMARQINALSSSDGTATRKIQQLIQALEDVEKYHQIEGNLQIKQFLIETRDYLKHMAQTSNVQSDYLQRIARISDCSYAWLVIGDFTELIQQLIKIDPPSVRLLESTILKLSSILDVPIRRIIQCNSPDLESVSDYYSNELVKYTRGVLQIIPQTVFKLLDDISALQGTLQEVPAKINRENIKDIACLNDRLMLASFTHQVSLFTKGIMVMEKTFLGLIQIDPRQLLEEGIRRELVQKVSQILNDLSDFRDSNHSIFLNKMEALADRLSKLRLSFEYIQDFLNLYGLKIWQEEFSRVIDFNTDLEASALVPIKQSLDTYQNNAVPIPRYPSNDPNALTFMGRLLLELFKISDKKQCIYLSWMNGWYDSAGNEVIGLDVMSKLHAAVGVRGLTGLDKVLGAMIVSNLKYFVRRYKAAKMNWLSKIWKDLQPMSSVPERYPEVYQEAINNMREFASELGHVFEKIGQKQLARRLINYQLNFRGRIDSPLLWSSLKTVNESIIIERITSPTSEKHDPLIVSLETFMNQMGFNSVFEKVFMRPGLNLELLPLAMALHTIKHVNILKYEKTVQTSSKKPTEFMDGLSYIAGIVTIFKQFHKEKFNCYLGYLGQFVTSGLGYVKDKKGPDPGVEVNNMLVYIEELRKVAGISRQHVENFLPTYALDNNLN